MVYRRASHTAWRAIADETIVLDLEKHQMYGLNETAAFLWQTLEAMGDFDQVLLAMGSEGDRSDLTAGELCAFCEELIALGLVRKVSMGPPPGKVPAAVEPPANLEPPRILWREAVEQIAASCAFLPSQSPLCTQIPFS